MHLLVAAYLGVKPTDSATVAAMPEQAASLMETFETRPMPKIMTPEEYLARKQQTDGQ